MHPHVVLLALIIGFLSGASIVFGPGFEYRGLFLLGVAGALIYSSLWHIRKLPLILVFLIGVVGAYISSEDSMLLWGDKQALSVAPVLHEERVAISAFPLEKKFYQEVRLKRACGEKKCQKQVLWQAPMGTRYHIGESFRFSCELSQVENFSAEFDYRMYLAKEGVGFICKEGLVGERLPTTLWGSALQKLEQGRGFTEMSLARALPEPELGLAKGLVLGGGQHLSKGIEEDFQRIGMTHIVAVSGYNILLVAGGCFFLFGRMGVWRRQKIFLGSVGVWIFIIFVGAPASAVRAGSMALLFFLAMATGRKSSGWIVLLASAFLMLAHNPLLLFYDIGFQLSFMALIGILVASTEYETETFGWKERLVQVVKTTLWVEALILPLIMYHFGILTWFSLIANIVLLPLIPLAMLGTFALLPLGALLPSIFLPIVTAPVYALLWVLIRFAEYFGAFPWVQVSGVTVAWPWLLCWYGAISLYVVVQLRRRKRNWYAKAFLVAD
jgi:competence protein ComEC